VFNGTSQFLLETEPAESEQMLEHLGTAFPVYLNFAVTGMDRLVREVRSALHRRKREEGAARHAVDDQMRSEMRETLTSPCSSPVNWQCPSLTFPTPRWKKFGSSTISRANSGFAST
jgi:hypothetical protein